LLDKQGVMVVHSIGRPKPAPSQGPFNEKYIFPGGYIPAVSEVVPAIEKAGFLIKDIEILPMHYAWTLKEWRRRFMANREEAARIYDERFCRMWELYLAASESAFSHDRMFIMQFQLAKFQHAVPFTRDYLARTKADLERLEGERMTRDEVVL
jgi:cyclopropane-fatty-acyl-phospholipid synthase